VIDVLIVEDSASVREFLLQVLKKEPDMRVIGLAENGEQALTILKDKKPAVIMLDMIMPKMDGFEAARRIMETTPTPIVIVTASYEPDQVAATFKALEAGALAAVPKPNGFGHRDHEASVRTLIRTVRTMSEVKVVRRRPRAATTERASGFNGTAKVVAIGASTGGPIAIQEILSALPLEFPAPILIVQHMASGFVPGFVRWLSQKSPLPVHIALGGERVQAGHVYIAPDDLHLRIDGSFHIVLGDDEPINAARPSVSCLFRSVAETFRDKAIGILLSGMGKDGSEELKLIRDAGGITIAQDKETAIVYGMPGEAVKIGAAAHILAPDRIAGILGRLPVRK
jgi:two-component system, chemotaxis family, protein-glutamate methylesterase/glutaminase